MTDRRYWFRRKRFGWGLRPASREGWIATAVFVLVDAGGTFVLMPFVARSRPWILIAWAFSWLAAFTVLAIATAEPLWWDPRDRSTRSLRR
ncbi:MAG: hypothetical protein M3007_07890 [Candidatus Eremiobacteraeota bacterium]|nr:hypothetical protein [Candidatus Eremiobacteraeota bacterium]